MNSHEKRVYAVIPVFNRVEKTLVCIDCLKRQTHRGITIIVVDGGSTDGTPEIIAERHPDARVISGRGELWWGGATHVGIETALADGPADSDFVLMVNNDTEFGYGTVARLAETSRKHSAAVCGVVVSSDDPGEVIDGGISLHWEDFQFSTVTALPSDRDVNLDCDMLPGRCTLVPVWAIRKGGNVDSAAFPHYLADYEFTHRLKRRTGLALAVDYRAPVMTRVEPPSTGGERGSLSHRWQRISNRRSKSNFMDHLRFVWRHAPAGMRWQLILKLLLRSSAFCWHPLYRALQGTGIVGPSLVTRTDCRRHGLSAEALCRRGVLAPCRHSGHLQFRLGGDSLRRAAPEAMPLYWRSWNPLFKLRRLLSSRLAGPSRVVARPGKAGAADIGESTPGQPPRSVRDS